MVTIIQPEDWNSSLTGYYSIAVDDQPFEYQGGGKDYSLSVPRNGAIRFELEGPAEIIGDTVFALVGGTGAIWIRAREQSGLARLTAHHPVLGSQRIEIQLSDAKPEIV